MTRRAPRLIIWPAGSDSERRQIRVGVVRGLFYPLSMTFR